MAKRGNSGQRTKAEDTTSTTTSGGAATAAPDPMEQRIVAFAEQLGRIAGTVQAKAEGWMDRDALTRQMTGVRDGAAELLEQMKSTVSNAAGTAKEAVTRASASAKKAVTGDATGGKKSAVATPAASAGRSRGPVDAPGKKHRKPMPADPRAVAADARRSSIRGAATGMKTAKRRGRG